MTAMIVKTLTYILSTKILKMIMIATCEVLVKRTDTTIDDEILDKVKEYMKK